MTIAMPAPAADDMIRDPAMTRPLSLGDPSGPRVAVKECLGVQGWPTRAGSAAREDVAPETRHSDCVQALLSAGCHIVGLANMHELAFGMTGANAHTGTPVNPGWPDRIPGGSSSGSAVLTASGAVDFAIGTDTGGSVRQPACCCGIYGMKPSFGRISRRGAVPVSSSLDCIGAFARDAATLAQAMQALVPGLDLPAVEAPRLAHVPGETAPDVADALSGALAALGVTETRGLPGMAAAFEAAMIVISHEMAAEFGALAAGPAPMGGDVRQRILAGRALSDDDRQRAETVRAAFTQEVDRALDGLDALILPTLPVVPPTWQEARDPAAILPLTRFLRPFNLSGHPALTIPLRTVQGLPAGLQLVGAKGADGLLCALAIFIESRLTQEVRP